MVSAGIYSLIYSTNGLDKFLEKVGSYPPFEVYKTKYKEQDVYLQVSQKDEMLVFFRSIQNNEDRVDLIKNELFLHIQKKENGLEYMLEMPVIKNKKKAGDDLEHALDASFNVIDVLKRKGNLKNY